MNRHELDLTDSKVFEVDVTKSGNIVNVDILTNRTKAELVMDDCDYEELKKQMGVK